MLNTTDIAKRNPNTPEEITKNDERLRDGINEIVKEVNSLLGGVNGSFYVASTSGGSPTHLVTVTNGIITSIG